MSGDGASGRHGVPLPTLGFAGDWSQLSHRLRSPLNAILGNTELLLDGSAGPASTTVRAALAEVQAAARQLQQELKTLLLVARGTTAGVASTGPAIDLIALIHETLAAADGAPVMRVTPHGARFLIRGDPSWLRAIAVALADLHRATADHTVPPARDVEQRIDLERLEGAAGEAVLRAWWPGFGPTSVAPLQLALIGTVLRLHGGTMVARSDGLRLQWPPGRRPADELKR